ncbi:CBS domain-containing protein [Actinophytocola sp.]|uniref:CBS domain-containing protein n=1 Tax=Actinophytocola sp. TaxID=1872138 RepID=UPI002D805FCE|nr:CBS domain-containing protein [Actinophytocola sp.]HET9139923.1 CBS domain-containing protein [Actinophytocola sp.]
MNEMTVAAVMRRDSGMVRPHTPFKEILEQLADRDIAAVPVVSATGTVLGVVSELDLLRGRTRRQSGSGRLTAIELMTSPAPTVAADTPLAEASRTFVRYGWRQMFVVDNGRLVGVLGPREVLSVFRRPDKEILVEVEHEVLDRLNAGPDHTVRVSVDEGVVLLTGRHRPGVETGPELTRIAAIPGVIAVRERTR